jgi:uncharacterized Fe-S radical SAM superfamily protein PflX
VLNNVYINLIAILLLAEGIYRYAPHFGEEPPLVGVHGSGTIFFSDCSLACVFCQNYEISQLDQGTK